MPPIRLKLRDLPRMPEGIGDDSGGNVNNNQVASPKSSSAVGAGIAARTAEHLSDVWRAWPMATIASVNSTVKRWLAQMDAALLALPGGLGPAVSSLVSKSNLARSTRSMFSSSLSMFLIEVDAHLWGNKKLKVIRITAPPQQQ